MAKIKLTRNNYYSPEANQAYFSASQIKSFLKCPACAIAEINGDYEREKTSALQIGSYVDAMFSGKKEIERFYLENPGIFKKDGTLKAGYVKAEEMVARAKQSKVFMDFLKGRHQVIKTGDIDGFPFKARFDVYRKGERIVDLKTVKDMKPIYLPGQGRVDFATAWNWVLQMAIYQAIEGNHLPCYLAVITKETPSNIALIQIPQARMDAELELLKEKLPRFDAMKRGIIEADRCEDCAYCRETHEVLEPVSLDLFDEFLTTNIEV